MASAEYSADYKAEMSKEGDDHIAVYRGLGDDNFPDMKGSMRGSQSILARISTGSKGSRGSKDKYKDEKSLLDAERGEAASDSGEEEEERVELEGVEVQPM